MLLLFVFAAIEFSYANLIKNVMENAAVEGAREGILPGATAADCLAAANDYLDVMGIQNATVVVEPATFTTSTTQVSVTVTVPLSTNSMPMSQFVLGESLNQEVILPMQMR